MDKIRGVNTGNWMVLEKWMYPDLFAGTEAEDEDDLARMLPREQLKERLDAHRASYITAEDFRTMASWGLNTVRVPVPHFIFDDCPPYYGCIGTLDDAFEWAQAAGLKILIDLHTAPDSQNGFDNGGITGVCKWHKKPENIERTIAVLERMAQRYKDHPALYGIQFLNEPISPEMFERIIAGGRYHPRDPERAAGSEGVPLEVLYDFYTRAYGRLRRHLDENVALVFHDGFRLKAWKDFMRGPEYRNVVLDTHIYLGMMGPPNADQGFDLHGFMERALVQSAADIAEMRAFFPVVVGEWSVMHRPGSMGTPLQERAAIRAMGAAQLYTWEQVDGWFFWSYRVKSGAPGWDMDDLVAQGHLPSKYD
ncbi:MAG: cellulase family glycosylhydrolase [Anaerolineales bacterium]|nr:cellulase family glycosylhydrolase [Anaerolineales bacterium]